jgi:hypothetical protein
VAPPEEFWREVASEMTCDPARWCDAAAHGDANLVARPPTAAPVRDRLDEGIAAVTTELLTSGRPVLVLVAELDRRRAGLERLLAGAAPEARLAAVSWEALMGQPSLASPYEHVLALDPPPVPEAVSLAAGAPGVEMLHLAWGQPECDFTLAHWRAQLDLRPLLTQLWRALADGSLEGNDLERALRGSGAYPRGGRACGRMLRVLCELGLTEYTAGGGAAEPACRRLGDARTDLGLSAANRAYGARLQAVERYLAAKTPVRAATAADAG